MAVPITWFECDTRFIPAHHQPAVLLDLALGRGLDSHRLLRGTGLFHEDILAGNTLISPRQFLQLTDNTRRLLDADDTSFLFGQRLLPGHYGAASHALQQAADLHQALERLVRLRALLCPLLAPRLLLDERHAYLLWLDTIGSGEQQRFLVEASMTALASCSRWLAGERLPWRFDFAHAKPRYVEQYWEHLGEEVRFDRRQNLMTLPREYLIRPWPGAALTAGQAAQRQGLSQLETLGFEASFLDGLYDHLQIHIRAPLNLETVAQAFAMSPATLKRKLRKHGTHFQEQLDLARLHRALHLYQAKGCSNEEVAAELRFHDAANFRRTFKRWTGFSPSALRRLLD